MCDCDIDIFKDTIRKGRAWYVCSKCGADLTILLVFAYQSKEEDDKINAEKKLKKASKRKINNKKVVNASQ